MLRHEMAHMWWGHEVFWDTYRDQWLSEALANYSAMLMSEQDQPDKVRILMQGYRDQLLSKRNGRDLFEAGPVTLGLRLNSAKFPDAYDAMAYGRGVVAHPYAALHARRRYARSARQAKIVEMTLSASAAHRAATSSRYRHQHRRFAACLRRGVPESLRFEGRKSLDWFFDGWVNGTAIPSLEVSGVSSPRRASRNMSAESSVRNMRPTTW